jgi:hypothetical protein
MEQLPGGQCRGHYHAPVDSHGNAVAGCRDRIRNGHEGDMPAPRPVHRHPIRLHPRRDQARPAKPHPSRPWHPDLANVAGQAVHVPLRSAPHHRETLVPPGLAPRWPPGRVLRVEERGHRPGEVPQGLLLHRLRACGQPWILSPRPGELAALLQVGRSALAARVPVRFLLDGQVPYVPGVRAMGPAAPLLGRAWGAIGTGSCEHTIDHCRHFRGGDAAFLRPEGRDTTPQF